MPKGPRSHIADIAIELSALRKKLNAARSQASDGRHKARSLASRNNDLGWIIETQRLRIAELEMELSNAARKESRGRGVHSRHGVHRIDRADADQNTASG